MPTEMGIQCLINNNSTDMQRLFIKIVLCCDSSGDDIFLWYLMHFWKARASVSVTENKTEVGHREH